MDISSSLIVLQPGLYVLRHPKIEGIAFSVTRGPNCVAKFDILATPATHGTVLRNGADAIVMLVHDVPAELLVTVIEYGLASNMPPALKIDRIGLDDSASVANMVATPNTKSVATAKPAPTPIAPITPITKAKPVSLGRPIEIGPIGLSLIGHVELVGDMVAAPGETLGDPESAKRVEGFQLMWPDKPVGVDLAYNISVEGFGATPVVKTGQFCGTRGEARRITEATFTLVGPAAAQYQLAGVASFSGGFQVPIESGIPLSGPSGMEHLTALCLRPIENVAMQKNPWNDTSKTKVFKAKVGVVKKTDSKKADTRAAKPK